MIAASTTEQSLQCYCGRFSAGGCFDEKSAAALPAKILLDLLRLSRHNVAFLTRREKYPNMRCNSKAEVQAKHKSVERNVQ